MFLFCLVVCQRIDEKAIILALVQYKKVKLFFIEKKIFSICESQSLIWQRSTFANKTVVFGNRILCSFAYKLHLGLLLTKPVGNNTNSYVSINKKMSAKINKKSFPPMLTYVVGAQKNRLIETVLLSTYNICFS